MPIRHSALFRSALFSFALFQNFSALKYQIYILHTIRFSYYFHISQGYAKGDYNQADARYPACPSALLNLSKMLRRVSGGAKKSAARWAAL
jgi:hypothetical protein